MNNILESEQKPYGVEVSLNILPALNLMYLDQYKPVFINNVS